MEWTASYMTIAHGGSGSASTVYSPLKSFANIFISFVGAGVLGLPYAFRMVSVFFEIGLEPAAGDEMCMDHC